MIKVMRPENAIPRVVHGPSCGASPWGPVVEVTVAGGNPTSREELLFRAACNEARRRNWRGIETLYLPHDDGETATATYKACPKRDSKVELYRDEPHRLEIAKLAEGHTLTAKLEVTLVLRNGRWEFERAGQVERDYTETNAPVIHNAGCRCGDLRACRTARKVAAHIPLPESGSELADVLSTHKKAADRQARETRKRQVAGYRAAAATWRKLQQLHDGVPTAELIDKLREQEQVLAGMARSMPPGLAGVLNAENRLEMLLWRYEEEHVSAKRLRRELSDAQACIVASIRSGPANLLDTEVITVPYTPTLDEVKELKESRRCLGEAPVPEDEGRDYRVCTWCDQETIMHERKGAHVLVRDWHRTEVDDVTPGYYADEIDQCIRTGMLVEHRHFWQYT